MIMHRTDPTAVIRALRSAAPYIRLFKGKTFVVKAGGGVFGDPAATRALVEAELARSYRLVAQVPTGPGRVRLVYRLRSEAGLTP